MKIVYIAGAGRSGSTLLSLLLSQSSEVCNLGQSRDLTLAFRGNAVCACGAPVPSCRFWGTVVSRTCPRDPGGELQRFWKELKSLSTRHEPASIWRSPDRAAPLKKTFAWLLDHLRERLAICAELAGTSAFIDSSRSSESALALDLLPGVDLYVLHLVRDPRAVACSWQRKLSDSRRVRRQCRLWKQRQQQFRAYAQANPERYHLLRYEDFAREPRAAVQAALAWADLPFASDSFVSEHEAKISWDGQHLFPPANETILAQKSVEVPIRPSMEWQRPEYRGTRLVASALTFPENLRHGYGLL